MGAMKNRARQIGTALAAWVRRWWWVLAALFSVAIVLGIGIVLSFDVAHQTQDLMNRANDIPDDQVTPKDRVDLVRNAFQYQADNLAKLWTGIIGSLTGVAAVVAGVIAWRNLHVTQEGQITNRFTQAIGQLGAEKDGKPNLEVRLGGIYALERIARDSPRDHWTIMEVLTAYVRQNAPRLPPSFPGDPDQPTERELWIESWSPAKPRVDVQAILTVLGRRIVKVDDPEPGRVDLHDTNLQGADLTGAGLARAFLLRTDLAGATLRRASLEAADLSGANLEGADLRSAYLELTRLRSARLQGANLSGARLPGADLSAAHLQRAVFWRAQVGRANRSHAYVAETDFTSALGLTTDQVYSAHEHGEGARLPDSWPANWRDGVQPPQ